MKIKKLKKMKHEYQQGELANFPIEVIERMLDCQVEQGNPRDVKIFQENIDATLEEGGFDWYGTKEELNFWCNVIIDKQFDLFFEKYPKIDIAQLLKQSLIEDGYSEEISDEAIKNCEIIKANKKYNNKDVIIVIYHNLATDLFYLENDKLVHIK